ncbi:MAG: hypothetical protein ABIH48_01650 [Candidatus Falkowbacteria bacterium]
MENLPLLPIALFLLFVLLAILVIARYRRKRIKEKDANILQKKLVAIGKVKSALKTPWQKLIDKDPPPIPPITKETRKLRILIGMTGSTRTGLRLYHQGVSPNELQKELMKTDEEKEAEREKLRQTPLP